MKANEAITLDACLLALLHYGDSVPPSLHAQIQTANRQLSSGQPEAVKQLKNVIEQDERLKRLYTASREHLVIQYGAQERAKSSAFAVAESASTYDVSFNGSNGTSSLIDLATAILSSPDANYRATAQRVLNQPRLKKQLEQASEDLRVSAQEFSDAANQLHPTKIAIMKKLENNFFTPDDLAYSLEISLESAQRYIKSLWNEGYIRPTSSNLFTQIWQSFKGAPPLAQPPDIETPLTLTTKGNFYLHPGSLGRLFSKTRRFV